MNRRDWLRSSLGAVLLPFLPKKWFPKLTPESGPFTFELKALPLPVVTGRHLFDWSSRLGPFTTHPAYAGKLKTGSHNHLFLDGEELDYEKYAPFRFQTGPEGWVECRLYKKSGGFQTHLIDTWDGDKVLSLDDPNCPKYQERRPGPTSGSVEERYREEILTVTLRGFVAFMAVEFEFPKKPPRAFLTYSWNPQNKEDTHGTPA
jgi:hypothetical protein